MDDSGAALKGVGRTKQAFARCANDDLAMEQPPREAGLSDPNRVNATQVPGLTPTVQVKRNTKLHGNGLNRVFVGQDTYDAHRRTQSVTKLRNLFSLKFDLPNPSVLQIAVTLMVYFLAVSEIWRSYPHVKPLKYQKLEPSIYVNDGPKILPMVSLTKQADKSVTSNLAEIPSTRYKFDTSSLGLRSILALPNQQALTWPQCIKEYDTQCSSNVEPSVAFDMLESLAQTTNDNVFKTTTYRTLINCSSLEQVSNNLYTCGPLGLLPKRLRFAIRAKARWIMTPSTMLGRFILDRRRWLSTWVTQFKDLNNSDPGVNVCQEESDWPLLCEKPWADFSRLAIDPNSTEGSIGKLWDEINKQTMNLQKKFPSDLIDLTIVESESDPLTHSGGQVIVADKVFNIVVIFRVQTCEAAANDDNSESKCTTFRIDEHRYEGNLLMTDAVEWNFMTTTFRYIGQLFLILRIVCLFIGCYHALPGTRNAEQLTNFRAKLIATCKLFLSLPTQPVVFGSFIPPLCFTVAYYLDSVVVYFVDGDQMKSLSKLLSNNFLDIVRIISSRMRIVWAIVLVARIVVFFRTSAGWSPARGIIGFRAFLLSSLCFVAIAFAFHDRGIYDSRVLESNEVQAVPTLMALHAETRDGWKSCADGIFDDLWSFLLVVVIYFLSSTVCVRLFTIGWHHVSSSAAAQQVVQIKDKNQQQQAKLQHQHHKSVLFELSEVPYSAGILWDPSSLVICWEDFFARSTSQRATAKVSIHCRARKNEDHKTDGSVSSSALLSVASCMDSETTRYVFMNLVFLSDPWHFLNLRMTNSQVHLYELLRYERRRVLHPYSKTRFLREFDFQPEDVLLLGTFNVVDLAWDQVLFCN